MSNRRRIKASGHIPGQWTGLRWEVLDSPAWKATSPGARWLYVCLLRRLSYNAFNNGKVFRSTREAAREIGADHRSVWIWFKELEYYGFIAMTEPGSMGPKGRASRWRITDMAWGEMDGRPVEATKDYLKWGGALFERPSQKQKNGERNTTGRSTKYNTSVDQNTTAHPPPVDRNTTEGRPIIDESNTTNLGQPPVHAERGRAEATCRYCGEVTNEAALTELHQGFFIHEACQKDWRSNGRGN